MNNRFDKCSFYQEPEPDRNGFRGAIKDVRNFSKHLKFAHPVKNLINLELHDFQKGLLKRLQNRRFNIVKYGRQSGVSTLLAVYALWSALYHPEKTVYLFSGSMESAARLLAVVKQFYDSLELIKPKITHNMKNEIQFETRSRIIISTYDRSHYDLCGVSMDLMLCDLFGGVSDKVANEFRDNSFYRLNKDGGIVITTLQVPNNALTKQIYEGKYREKFNRFNIYGSQINRSTQSEKEAIEQMGWEKFKEEFNY
jgi:hypothetical protein